MMSAATHSLSQNTILPKTYPFRRFIVLDRENNRQSCRSETRFHFFVEYYASLLNSKSPDTGTYRGAEFHVMAETNTNEKIALGSTRYLPEGDQLLGADGVPIFLRAQSARVLHYMAQRLGVLVTRDELIDDVWHGLSVTDDSLTQCIADVRRAIGDTNRTILKTIPKRGFVLNGAPVSAPRPSTFENMKTARVSASGYSSGDPVIAYARDTAKTVELEGDGCPRPTSERVYRLPPKAHGGTMITQLSEQSLLPTISVIPLKNALQEGEDVLGSVFADVLTAVLGSSEEINVISRLSSATFANTNADLAEIGRQLNAEFVLSGFFIPRADRLQINLEFAEVATQRMLWAFRLELPVADLLGDFEAAHEIVAKVRRAILINEIRRVNTTPLADMKNYSLMFAAVGLMHRLSPNDFRKARVMLDALSERASNHPVPLAWTARWHLLRVVQGWSENPDADAHAALRCTGRALDLDPENVLALACEGHVLTNLLHRLDDAEDRYNLALEANPNDANARSLRGMMLAFQGRGAEGVHDTERALHLSPLDPHRFFYLAMAAGAYLTPGDFEKAEKYAKASLLLNRTHISTLRMLAVAQQKSGKTGAAQETVSELMRLQPGLRVQSWLKSSPSAEYDTGRQFAQALRDAGVPD